MNFISCNRQIVIIERLINQGEDPFRNPDITENQKETCCLEKNPVQIRIAGKPLCPGREIKQFCVVYCREVVGHIFDIQGRFDSLLGPP
jgi:hypothetical protein